MADDSNTSTYDRQERRGGQCGGALGGAYGLAFIGALVYYIQHATSFWIGALGFFKALIWPALLIYNLLRFLKM